MQREIVSSMKIRGLRFDVRDSKEWIDDKKYRTFRTAGSIVGRRARYLVSLNVDQNYCSW